MNAPEDFEAVDNHAVFRLAGRMSLEQAVQRVTAAITFAREQNIRRLLVIASALAGFDPPSIVTRYYFIQEWARASRGVVRVAVVARPEMIDPQKFGVTVAANSGMVADVFVAEEQAMAWLQGVR